MTIGESSLGRVFGVEICLIGRLQESPATRCATSWGSAVNKAHAQKPCTARLQHVASSMAMWKYLNCSGRVVVTLDRY